MDSENIAAIARAIHEARRQSRFGAQALWEYEPPEITAHYLELAQAALSAIKAQGYAVVPVEPTEAMVRAMCVAIEDAPITDIPDESYQWGDSWRDAALWAYRAMLAAQEPRP